MVDQRHPLPFHCPSLPTIHTSEVSVHTEAYARVEGQAAPATTKLTQTAATVTMLLTCPALGMTTGAVFPGSTLSINIMCHIIREGQAAARVVAPYTLPFPINTF